MLWPLRQAGPPWTPSLHHCSSPAPAPAPTVLIDEAGQASEVAALQPLVFGARRVVLVGDPQQLPATILSELAKQVWE